MDQTQQRRTLAVATAGTVLAMAVYTTPLATLAGTAAGLGAGPAGQAWILSSMSLGLAVAMLPAGALGDARGRRRTYVAGALVVAATAVAAALAPSTAVLVVARVGHGLGVGALLACGLGLVGHAFPPGLARLRATGVWGASLGVGIAVGPLLAAGLEVLWDWRAAYWALAALALLLAAAARLLPAEHRATDPVVPVGSARRVGSARPVGPMGPVSSTDPERRVGPVGPAGVAGRFGGGAEPAGAAGRRAGAAVPVGPVRPAGAVGPVGPAGIAARLGGGGGRLGGGAEPAGAAGAAGAAARAGGVDVPGALLLGAALAAVLAGLVLARTGGPGPAAALLGGGVLLGAAFALVELRRRAPLLDPRQFRRPDLAGATVAALATGAGVIAAMSFLPTVLQRGLGRGVPLAAAVLFAWSATSAVAALLARHLRVSASAQLVAGLLGVAAGLLLLTGLDVTTSPARLLPGLLVAGVASGVLNAALARQAVASMPAGLASVGSGVNNTARFLGAAVGVTVVAVLAAHPAAADVVAGWDVAAPVTAAVSVLGAAVVWLCRPRDRHAAPARQADHADA